MKREIKHRHHAMSPEKIFLYSGEVFLLFTLFFLVVSSGDTNSIAAFVVPLVMAVVALFLTTRFVK
jgi:Zn-dependent protease with chaperone function